MRTLLHGKHSVTPCLRGSFRNSLPRHLPKWEGRKEFLSLEGGGFFPFPSP